MDNGSIFKEIKIEKEKEISWGPFRIYQPISTANQTQFSSNWMCWLVHYLIHQTNTPFFRSTKEEDVQPPPGLNNLELWKSQNDSTSGTDPNLDSTWTPSRKCELNSPTPMVNLNTEQPSQPNLSVGHTNKLSLESPPEAAIEATPETTPFVTPVKVQFALQKQGILNMIEEK